jgi:hypothetical protein
MSAIHIVRFHLDANVIEQEFLAVNEQFQREAKSILPGLERREACRAPDGEWFLVLRYRDLPSAKQQGAPSEVGKRLMSMIDKKTMSSAFCEVVSE